MNTRDDDMTDFELPGPPPLYVGPLIDADFDWTNNACLDRFGATWTLYARGYLDAARLLVKHVVQTGTSQDFLVFPIVFLFRQYTELTLKHLIISISGLLGEEQGPGKSHKLVALWARVQPLVAEMEARMSQTILDQAERNEIGCIIAELEQVDDGAFTFRYPETTLRQPSLPDGLQHLNIRRFGDGIERLAHLLDRLVNGADYFHDYFGPGNQP
jgi:hypothetical protein